MPSTPVLYTENLSRTFTSPDGDIHAVDSLTVSIPEGQTIALLGSNGAGKSTLINLILGLDSPTSGSLTVCGTSPQEASRSGAVGALLQQGGLRPDWTVRDTLRALCDMRGQLSAYERLVETTGLTPFMRQRISTCSGGQVQRLRLAIALIQQPRLLLMDEPTTGMDPHARRDFWRLITEVRERGSAVLFATHVMEEASAYADSMWLMHRGHLLAHGTHGELLAQAGVTTLEEAFFALTDAA